MFGKEARKTAEYGYIGVPSADPNEDRQTIAENFAVLVKAWEGGRLPIGELPEGSGMIACFGGSWLSCRDRMTENHAAVGPLSSGRGINPITIWRQHWNYNVSVKVSSTHPDEEPQKVYFF